MDEKSTNAPISSEEYKKVTESLYKQNLELARLYKQVDKLNHELEIANDGQSNLIHIINHQIKGYLAKARNIFSELSSSDYGKIPEQAKPMLEEGFRSMTEGVDFVKDFLDAANIDQGSFEYNMEELDFKSLVETVAENEKSSAEEKNLSFKLEVAEGDYKLKGDKVQLGQAVRNLIDNSVRYTPKGGLTASLVCSNGKVLLTVKDTGVGLDDELKPRLFSKGARGKDSIKINVNSTGFGLAFVKAVVEAHRGRVWAESPGVGQGSTFFMELPMIT